MQAGLHYSPQVLQAHGRTSKGVAVSKSQKCSALVRVSLDRAAVPEIFAGVPGVQSKALSTPSARGGLLIMQASSTEPRIEVCS